MLKIPLRYFLLTDKDFETGECIQQNIEDNAGVKKMAAALKLTLQISQSDYINRISDQLSDQPSDMEEAAHMFKFKVLKALQKGEPTEKFGKIARKLPTFEEMKVENPEAYEYEFVL